MSNEDIKAIDAVDLATEAYKEYSHYVNTGRAAPNLIDGAKSVYKRLIYGCYKNVELVKLLVLNIQFPLLHIHNIQFPHKIYQLLNLITLHLYILVQQV
mgnify:CR=1 FL=1